MELQVLKPFSGGFKRDRVVDDWSSLIWTERYSTAGDFELHSPAIGNIIEQLPLGDAFDDDCIVAIRGSDVPMVVESHKIEKKSGEQTIITTGRSFETVMDRRVTIQDVTSGVARTNWQIEAVSSAVAAYEVMKSIIEDGDANPLDIIPEILLLNGVSESGVTIKYPVEPKELYAWVLDTLNLNKYGLKSTLPIPADSQIAVTIYNGTDRTEDVVFDVALDQIDSATYLLTKLGYKNAMITSTANGMEEADTGVDPNTSSAPTGLKRRVDFQDISADVTLAPGSDLTTLTINKGKLALASRLPIALFAGGIAESVADGFGSTYFLGDIVKLAGEYGLSQNARVAEFVRTHDTTGEKSYPTFESVTL